MNLPRFSPAAPPTEADGRVTRVAAESPRCAACGAHGELDASTGLERDCWRFVVLLPFVLNVGPKDGGA